ncbi:MAG: hypothetical protein ACJZ14_01070 [Candidatus Neomarinimicrobiota bacterium]
MEKYYKELGNTRVWELVDECCDSFEHINTTFRHWIFLNKEIIMNDMKDEVELGDTPEYKEDFMKITDVHECIDWMDTYIGGIEDMYYGFCDEPDNEILGKIVESNYWGDYDE